MTSALSARLTAAYRTHRRARMVRHLERFARQTGRIGPRYVNDYSGPVARKASKVAA